MKTYGAEWSEHPHYKQDPLPKIKPALLNSLDIKRYVEKECLLDLDSFDECRMKPASYEMKLLGTLYYWEEVKGRPEKRCKTISEDDCVELGRNSISYLWIEEPLRLPEYIAARFNLRIREVHKGILLGTGPLIDPGFGGRILIPLHNLTDNSYVLRGGDGIIWVEFTKVSRNSYWLEGGQDTERPLGLVSFPTHKITDDPDDYLNKAGSSGGVQSAFKGALDKAESAAEAANESAKTIRTRITIGGIAALITFAVAIVELIDSAYQVSGQVTARVDRQVERINQLEIMVDDLKGQLNETVVRSEDPVIPEEEERKSAEELPVDDNATREGLGKSSGSQDTE